MLVQRCINVAQRSFDVVSTSGFDVVSTLCNVEKPTLDFVSISTSDQRYFNVDPQHWNNVDPTLKCWLGNSCSALPVKKLVNTFQGRLYSNISIVNISNKSRGDHTQKTWRRTKLISTFYSTHPPQKCHANAVSDSYVTWEN